MKKRMGLSAALALAASGSLAQDSTKSTSESELFNRVLLECTPAVTEVYETKSIGQKERRDNGYCGAAVLNYALYTDMKVFSELENNATMPPSLEHAINVRRRVCVQSITEAYGQNPQIIEYSSLPHEAAENAYNCLYKGSVNAYAIETLFGTYDPTEDNKGSIAQIEAIKTYATTDPEIFGVSAENAKQVLTAIYCLAANEGQYPNTNLATDLPQCLAGAQDFLKHLTPN